jgi:hypothetical protein
MHPAIAWNGSAKLKKPACAVERNLISGLLVSFRKDWPRRQEAMKTAGSENQNRWATVRSKRGTGTEG